jgi:hypothetical protein
VLYLEFARRREGVNGVRVEVEEEDVLACVCVCVCIDSIKALLKLY